MHIFKQLDVPTRIITGIAIAVLLVLIAYRVVPIRTASIRVPVTTTKAFYQPREMVRALFFGEIYREGHVDIIRKLYCDGYIGFITDTRDGDKIFQSTSVPHTLDGRAANVGPLPDDFLPTVDTRCVIQFENQYPVDTPFGVRTVRYFYYTTGFTVRAYQPAAETSSAAPTAAITESEAETGSTVTQTVNVAPAASPQATPAPTPFIPPTPKPVLQRVLDLVL